MNVIPSFNFLRRVRIHGEECGAVARALHHETKSFKSSSAAIENVLVATKERTQMSKKTFFKRIALVTLASLGFGFLPSPISQAALSGHTVSLSSSTGTATVGDTATVTLTHSFSHTLTSTVESATVRYSCEAPATKTCPTLYAYQAPTADTAGVTRKWDGAISGYYDMKDGTSGHGAHSPGGLIGWTDSSTTSASEATRSAISMKAVNFSAAGTYIYTFYATNGKDGTSGTNTASVTWTVTASAANTTAASIARKYVSSDQFTAKNNMVNLGASSDSAIVADKGSASSPTIVGYAFLVLANSSGDTSVVVGSVRKTVDETVTVTVSGPGLVDEADAPAASTAAKSATLNVIGDTSQNATETLTIFSDGTAGTMTITFSKGTTTFGTQTVTFTGAASTIASAITDTYTYYGVSTVTLNSQIKDSGANLLTSGTFYVMSTDTKVISAGATLYSNASTQYQTSGRCGASSGWNVTTKRLSCTLTVGDSGTATIYLADSWNVTASTAVSTGIVMTVSEAKPHTVSVAFDKATYAPGELAVVTITASDYKARNLGSNGTTGLSSAFSSVISTPTLTASSSYGGTQGTSPTTTSFASLNDGAIETRVVTMPTYGTDISYEIKYTKIGEGSLTTAKATAKVVDPNATAIAAAHAAADAATDAAAEAIDASNAATDAANLAAEAADAATVAAEEARDAADAATAAVEELAAQVATLMAALKAQITTLANTVAKIAKKIKA